MKKALIITGIVVLVLVILSVVYNKYYCSECANGGKKVKVLLKDEDGNPILNDEGETIVDEEATTEANLRGSEILKCYECEYGGTYPNCSGGFAREIPCNKTKASTSNDLNLSILDKVYFGNSESIGRS